MGGRLRDGRVEMDSNFVENQIRPIKLTAKNARFAGHNEGARMGLYHQPVRDLQDERRRALRLAQDHAEKIAAGHPDSRIDELLPWSFKPPSS